MLGASIGLMGLSGAAEPILDGGFALGVYALWLLWSTPARRWSLLIGVGFGVVLGLALAGAQLVPGALIQAQSQRAIHSYTYFTSGSMNKSLTLLGLDPLYLGTSGGFPLHFFATYSLPEVSSYIGIMPLMGVLGLLARRFRRRPRGAAVVDLVRDRPRSDCSSRGETSLPWAICSSTSRCSTDNGSWRATCWRWTWPWR